MGSQVAVNNPPETLWNLTVCGTCLRCERGPSEDQIKIRVNVSRSPNDTGIGVRLFETGDAFGFIRSVQKPL